MRDQAEPQIQLDKYEGRVQPFDPAKILLHGRTVTTLAAATKQDGFHQCFLSRFTEGFRLPAWRTIPPRWNRRR